MFADIVVEAAVGISGASVVYDAVVRSTNELN